MLTLESIAKVAERLAPYVPKTPLIYSAELSRRLSKRVWFKMESLQPTGSFKVRPAFYSILDQLVRAQSKGVVASSSGNFAQAVAYASQRLGLKSKIVMMQKTSFYKVSRTKKLGADVVLCGNSLEERIRTTQELAEKTGSLLVQPFDSEQTIAGDATCGWELLEQIESPMAVIVPVSGGGLLAGMGVALKEGRPGSSVYGIQSVHNGSLKKSLAAGERVHVGEFQTLCDALISPQIGQVPWNYIQKYADGGETVPESLVTEAVEFLANEHKILVEPGAAVTVAALLTQAVLPSQQDIVCVLSGGNVNAKWNQGIQLG